MRVADVVRLLGCSKNTVYALIKEGRLESLKVGRSIIIPKACLVEYLTCEKNFQIVRKDPIYSLWTSKKPSGIMSGNKNQRSKEGK